MTTQQFPAQSPLNIRNPGNREGEYFDLDSLYMITLESCDADRQLLYHTLATPGYYLSRSCAVGSLLPSMLLRMRQGEGREVECAIFEADGGAWRNAAMLEVKRYLQEGLKDFPQYTVIS